MLLLKSIRRHQDRSMMHPQGLSPPFTFITREGLTPKHSHQCSTPWSVFQDGSLTTITPASLPEGAVLGPRKGIMHRAITLPEELRSQRFYPPAETDAGLNAAQCTGGDHRLIRREKVWSQTLPFQQFHVLFNPLFKVLFIFRSLYLCAIGLWPIFSFRRNLPPI